MCGVLGFLSGSSRGWDVSVLEDMAVAIKHRGPDGAGFWLDADAGIGMGHRRLSIVDLSSAGHQPMISPSGRYVISFNGEIYNHPTLRVELHNESVNWRGHSDTETLLAGFDAWGIENTIKNSIGMFALAVWDIFLNELTLVRDRLGEKPLYYGWQGDVFLFGSELNSLKKHPAFFSQVDRNSLGMLLQHSVIPAPYSIYKNIYKLLPGTLLKVSLTQRNNSPLSYWSVNNVVKNGLNNPFTGSLNEAVNELDILLSDAVAKQMMADVPLGAFLSGGIDSSIIVALMQSQSKFPVRTFTIGFCDQKYNEAKNALAVARHLGTEHTEIYITAEQALDTINSISNIYSEPFADSSQVPTFLVSQLARQHVSVSLSGDGGDELFGGYSRYFFANKLNKQMACTPVFLRQIIASLIKMVSPDNWNSLSSSIMGLFPVSHVSENIGDKLHKGANIMAARSEMELYRLLTRHWSNPNMVVLGGTVIKPLILGLDQQPTTDHFIHQMMALDLVTYLPDDILTKVDRAAMSVSLETRVPMLDHRVVEFAWRLPLQYKIHNGVGKWPLRQVLYKYVPKELVDRPKMGFAIPIANWLRGPLRDWAENLLDESRLREEGYFNPILIRQKWTEHLLGTRNWQHLLWSVLMFQVWLENEKS